MDACTRIQELERENAQLRERLQQQEDANAQLHKQVEQLQRELEEWKRGHRVRPRRTRHGCQAPTGKRPGRQRGHVGSGRPCPGEAEVGHEVHHSPEHCPGYGQLVVPTGAVKTHYVEELVPARRRVVARRLYGYFCLRRVQDGKPLATLAAGQQEGPDRGAEVDERKQRRGRALGFPLMEEHAHANSSQAPRLSKATREHR